MSIEKPETETIEKLAADVSSLAIKALILSPDKVRKMRHALGSTDKYLNWTNSYRNYFCAGPDDLPTWQTLRSMGLAKLEGESKTTFTVTWEGAQCLAIRDRMDSVMETKRTPKFGGEKEEVVPGEVVLWSTDDGDEHLSNDCQGEAILGYIDNLLFDESDAAEVLKGEGSIEVYGYARKTPNAEDYHGWVIQWMGEHLDEEFGSCDYDLNEEPTSAMVAAEATFIDKFIEEYKTYACEIVETESVNLFEYVRKHMPDILSEAAKKDETP